MRNSGSQAYPSVIAMNVVATGLTKREAFAMAAMQGLSININDYQSKAWANDIAVNAVNIADSLLAELEK